MKRFLLAVLTSVILPLALLAQTDTMMSLARAELQKRGLDEMEVRTRLLQNGIDVDNIPPTEYASYQTRVIAILDQMQNEKQDAANAVMAAQAGTASPADSITGNALTPAPQTTDGEAKAEAALQAALQDSTFAAVPDEIYGHSLFSNGNMGVFRTTDGAQAPDTYILGEGDEVHISIFGSSQTEIHQRIGVDGSIQPVGSTKIFLKGMTLAQGRQAIINKLGQHYSFRKDQIAVTITTARTVTVSIYGEVGVQGGFTLSALNTTFNALLAAGGPTAIGSVRNIQLSRGGKTSTLDLYKYMTGTASGENYSIQNGDVIFVPVAQKVVSIEGFINRPMRYEIVDGETLADLIKYAGGTPWDSSADLAQVERHEGSEVSYQEYKLQEVLSGAHKVSLQSGDVVRIKAANNPVHTYVAIEGDVYYDGRFDLAANRTLSALLENAKPRHTARTDFVFVERTKDDETVEVITAPFPGINGNADFALRPRDKVTVLNQADYRDLDTIAVSGEVRNPFTKEFGLNDRMTVSQAIEFAGGLKPSVFPVAYIFRRDLTNPDKMQYIRVSLDSSGDMQLQPGDRLNIYDNTTYTNVGEVRISGAVKNPFSTAYDPSLTVHDLIEMAGGFEVGAAYDKIELFRVNISKTNESSFEKTTISVDSAYNPTSGDVQLQPFDQIIVRMTPNFTTGRSVEINGRVRYPGVYMLQDSRSQLSDVIKMAGGLLDDADPYAILFRTYNERGNITVNLDDVKSHKGNTKCDPIMMEGDVVNITRQENTVIIRETGTRMSQYVPADFMSTEKVITYQGPHSAAWYVRNYAGGFLKTVERNSVTVTLPNNQAIGTKRILGIRKYPTVQPGAVITMRMDVDKQERLDTPKEKIDWGAELRSTLSALTSTVSLILLIDRLK